MPKVQSRLMQESTLAFHAAVKIAIAESSAVTSCENIDSSFQGGARKAEQLSITCLRNRAKQQNVLAMWKRYT